MSNVPFIFKHEFEALLEALRRDLRTEQEKAQGDTRHREWHLGNVRYAMRLLEILNPRGPERLMYRPIARAA
jgi:hypothetical protein